MRRSGARSWRERAASDNDAGNRRFEAKIGDGMSVFGDRFTGSPEIGIGIRLTARF